MGCSTSAVSLQCQQNFVLIGPPGSGKGTFSSYMTTTHNYCHICPGDILRAHIRNETDLGKEIKPIVERGDYIKDSIVFKIIEDRIVQCIENEIPFIIDGFPRSESSYAFLDNLFSKKKLAANVLFVHFQISNQTCVERIDKRLFCFECSSVFNSSTNKPQKEMVCDTCGSDLEVRLGDNADNTKKRLVYFREYIEPLIDIAHEKYRVVLIDAEASLDECVASYRELPLQ